MASSSQPQDSADDSASHSSFHVPQGGAPDLGAMIIADYEAVRNDLDQARQLAADFQYQLSGKSNEVAELKTLLERSSGDLNKLQVDIMELRKERHRLANEVNRVVALELRLDDALNERDQIRGEHEQMKSRYSAQAQALALAQSQIQAQAQAHAAARAAAAPPPLPSSGTSVGASASGSDPAVHRALSKLLTDVASLRGLVEAALPPALDRRPRPSPAASHTPPAPAPKPQAQNMIDISYND